jgi:hypothetical protein
VGSQIGYLLNLYYKNELLRLNSDLESHSQFQLKNGTFTETMEESEDHKDKELLKEKFALIEVNISYSISKKFYHNYIKYILYLL